MGYVRAKRGCCPSQPWWYLHRCRAHDSVWTVSNRETHKIIREAQADERAAHAAAQAANPMGKGRFTTPEALKRFSDAQAAHAKAQARVSALLKLRG